MRVRVQLFAAAAQTAESRAVDLEVPDGATLAQVADALTITLPALKRLISISRWAVDQDFAPLDTSISEHQEIALIPPVSGG